VLLLAVISINSSKTSSHSEDSLRIAIERDRLARGSASDSAGYPLMLKAKRAHVVCRRRQHFDADGVLDQRSASWPVPEVRVADASYFKVFKSTRDHLTC